ncbi:MAG: class I SAM-dependent methyltransferase [Verrucomicrobia bacterium]|nr:class I SAM-dependent methyltransferase [Verrucomicrobiota bacterium]
MISIRILSLLLSAALASGLWVSCQTKAPPVAAPSAEPSVRPGVNTEYLKPDLQVEQWVERFEREGREIYTQRHEIVQVAKIRRGQEVADIGAGTGLFTPLLAEAVGPRGKVYAVDIVKTFLEHIQKRVSAAGLRNVATVLCTERSVELPKNSIDVAFICDVYHHFEYPHSSLASLHRALRRNGELVLVEFKRIPGQSSDWVLNHVRAGQEVFTAEIEAAGFKKIEQIDLLKENYVLRFRKVKR